MFWDLLEEKGEPQRGLSPAVIKRGKIGVSAARLTGTDRRQATVIERTRGWWGLRQMVTKGDLFVVVASLEWTGWVNVMLSAWQRSVCPSGTVHACSSSAPQRRTRDRWQAVTCCVPCWLGTCPGNRWWQQWRSGGSNRVWWHQRGRGRNRLQKGVVGLAQVWGQW
jgi:hypothetical protein